MNLDTILRLVNSTAFFVVEGAVKKADDTSLWITQTKGGTDICLSSEGDLHGCFLPGHMVRCVACDLPTGTQLIKALNQTTQRTIMGIQDERRPEIPGVVKLGVLSMLSVNPILAVTMLVPLINWLVAILYLLLAIGQAQETRNGWSHFGVGVMAFVGGLILLPWAPTIGLVVALGRLNRQMLLDINEIHDRADTALATPSPA
jgi:hypothetical protein